MFRKGDIAVYTDSVGKHWIPHIYVDGTVAGLTNSDKKPEISYDGKRAYATNVRASDLRKFNIEEYDWPSMMQLKDDVDEDISKSRQPI